MKKIHIILISILSVLIVSSVYFLSGDSNEGESIKIALSKAQPLKSYHSYIDWIHSADSTIETIDMYQFEIDSALKLLETCSGLLLTGGEDIYPGLYGKIQDTALCGTFDLKRDRLEQALIHKAIELDIPILGICRGQQMLNVALGGSLIVDIPSQFGTKITHRIPDTYECFHSVEIEAKTRLSWASEVLTGEVTSRHHQAVDQLSDKFIVSAKSSDHLIEAIEWKEQGEQTFIMGVQWHPEKMDWNQALSKSILEYFIMEVKNSNEILD